MNDHNLDDIIIDNIEPKTSKTKSFLTIIALLIVVLIVAIILTKIILKDPDAEKFAFEENNTEMISPELTLQSAAEPETMPKPDKEEETKLSTIIESELKAPDQVEEVVKETVEITKEVIKMPVPPKAETEVKDNAKEKAETQKEEAEKVVIKDTIQKEVKPIPPKIVEKAKVKPAGRPVNVPVKSEPASSEAYYIQVGSFTKTPSKQFLGIIKNSGFNYKITPVAANGTKKLLIGPYNSRASADSALAGVKDRINKNAFVVKR